MRRWLAFVGGCAALPEPGDPSLPVEAPGVPRACFERVGVPR